MSPVTVTMAMRPELCVLFQRVIIIYFFSFEGGILCIYTFNFDPFNLLLL